MRLLQWDDLMTCYQRAPRSSPLRAFTEVFAVAIEMSWTDHAQNSPVAVFDIPVHHRLPDNTAESFGAFPQRYSDLPIIPSRF